MVIGSFCNVVYTDVKLPVLCTFLGNIRNNFSLKKMIMIGFVKAMIQCVC